MVQFCEGALPLGSFDWKGWSWGRFLAFAILMERKGCFLVVPPVLHHWPLCRAKSEASAGEEGKAAEGDSSDSKLGDEVSSNLPAVVQASICSSKHLPVCCCWDSYRTSTYGGVS